MHTAYEVLFEPNKLIPSPFSPRGKETNASAPSWWANNVPKAGRKEILLPWKPSQEAVTVLTFSNLKKKKKLKEKLGVN